MKEDVITSMGRWKMRREAAVSVDLFLLGIGMGSVVVEIGTVIIGGLIAASSLGKISVKVVIIMVQTVNYVQLVLSQLITDVITVIGPVSITSQEENVPSVQKNRPQRGMVQGVLSL